ADRLASVTDARGNTTRFEYNERGLLIKKINPGGTLQKFDYDVFGNRTRFTDELRHTWTRRYDEFRRVIADSDPLGRVTQYTYDLLGGICGCTHTDDKPSKIRLPSGLIIGMIYDVEWQLIGRTVGFGSSDAATTKYKYDAAGNQTTIKDPRGDTWMT